jgi:RHS repeat-associated protein
MTDRIHLTPGRLYDPGNPSFSDLSTIEPDKGYYIYMTQDVTLTVSGSPITSDRQIELQPGWNLVGWTTIEQRPARDALAGIAPDPQHVAWGLDELDAADPWKFYAFSEAGSDLVEFESGEGYWVHVSNAEALTVPAPAEEEYHYDSEGRRLGSIVIYDGHNQIAKYDDLGNLLVSYFQGPGIDNPISMRRAAAGGDEIYYYHTDALGSVTELTDAAGAVMQSYRYDAFGSIIQQSGIVQNPFTYTGREFDPETGLYYYRARYYDRIVGRFLSRDPIGKYTASNLYSYLKNSPPNYVDPRGLQPIQCVDDQCQSCYIHKLEGRYCEYYSCRIDHCVTCPPGGGALLDDCQNCCHESWGGGWMEPICLQECTNSGGCSGPP